MALPVEYREFTPKNSRQDLIRKLEQAPEEHAAALLSAYDLLERLHDKGLLDIANGLLSASDTVVDRAVDVASSKPAVHALRLALIFGSMLESIDPDRIHALLSPPETRPPSLWKIVKAALSADARRGLAAAIGLLNVFGAALRPAKRA